MKNTKPYIKSFFKVLLMGIISINATHAQTEDTNDLESWNSITIKYKPNKKWNFELQEQLRLDENISEVSEYFTQLSVERSIFKNFDFGVGLRFIRENDNEGSIQGYENHFRFHLDAMYKHKINDLTLKYRLRYQNKNDLSVSTSEGDYAKQNIRFKAGLEYNFKSWKLDPKFSAELFNRFQKDDDDNGFSKYRLTLGTDYKFKKLGKLGLFYRIEKDLNETIPETTNIIGLKYVYTIKNK
ncbi:MAG: DUF2490 domain-containing protein [Flavobacteriaceae bacterium]